MVQPTDSLLKYENPVLVTSSREGKGGGKVGPQDVSPPSKPKSASSVVSKQKNEEILNIILPPREWLEGNQLWVQNVSNAPCTTAEVIHLEEQLDTKLRQRQARETGICPVRRELYSQCFDELIRQVTINCAERGLLLLRVRDEIQMTMADYHTLYESSVAFGMRKALQADQDKADMEKRISDLERENQDLKEQLYEEEAKCEAIEKREKEKAEIEEKKHNELIHSLRKTHQQLQTQLEMTIAPKK